MARGSGRDVMIIGEEPGRTETRTAKAFSGTAGKRLRKWFIESRIFLDDEDFERGVYLTSVLKCRVLKRNQFSAAARNCFPFLEQQVKLVRPRIITTLGTRPLTALFSHDLQLNDVVGKSFSARELRQDLFSIFPDSCRIIPLPHPSHRSLWLNIGTNRKKLEAALEAIKGEMAHDT